MTISVTDASLSLELEMKRSEVLVVRTVRDSSRDCIIKLDMTQTVAAASLVVIRRLCENTTNMLDYIMNADKYHHKRECGHYSIYQLALFSNQRLN